MHHVLQVHLHTVLKTLRQLSGVNHLSALLISTVEGGT